MDDAEAVELVAGAVAIPSPSRDEAAVVAYLERSLAGAFEHTTVDTVGNLVATRGRGPRTLTLLGHVDTAPGWWPVRHEGGVIHGRGAVDAKGPLCAMAVAAARLGPNALSRLRIRLIGAVEEEAAGSRGARFAATAYEPPDLVVIGEPSGWDAITLGYKGRLTATIASSRASGHSARAEDTAAAAAVRAWIAVETWAHSASAGANGAFDAVQATLLDVWANDDGIAQRAGCTVGVRLPPRLEPAVAAGEIGRVVADVADRTGVGIELACDAFETAYRGPRDTPLTRAFRSAIRANGGTPRTVVKTGTSDMNVVAPAWRVPMVAYGPGDSGLDHTPDEHLRVDEYLRAIAVLVDAMEALARAPAPPARTSEPGRDVSEGCR